MFGRVKKFLGIEGVKVELIVPEEIPSKADSIDGVIRLYSMHEQTVSSIRVRLIEKYKRGRRGNKLVDEYTLGEIELVQNIDVPEDEYIEVEFNLPFQRSMSEMDQIQAKNIIYRGAVKTAKLLKGVASDFRIEAEAQVQGTALNPFDMKELVVLG